MRLFLVIVLAVAAGLSGCDLSVRSCLASEQQKAELAMNLQEETELQARLAALSDLDELLARHLAGTSAWIEDNPRPAGQPQRPSYPSLQCADAAIGAERDRCRAAYDLEWSEYSEIKARFKRELAVYQRSTSYLAWQSRAEKESLRLANEIGFPSKTYNEFRAVWDDYFLEVDTVVKPRSQIYECFRNDNCDAYTTSDDAVQIYRMSIAEVQSSQARLVTQMKREASEAAQRLCN